MDESLEVHKYCVWVECGVYLYCGGWYMYLSVCSKFFNLPFKYVHCLYECYCRLLLIVYYYLFMFIVFFSALMSRFGEMLYRSRVFVVPVIIRASSRTEHRTSSRLPLYPCLKLYYSLTNTWAQRRPSLSYWHVFLSK